MISKLIFAFCLPLVMVGQELKTHSSTKPKQAKNEIGYNLYSVTDLQLRINNVFEKQHV